MLDGKCSFVNTLNRETETLPITAFLCEYPAYGKHLAQVIEAQANDPAPLTAAKIQRICQIRYSIADRMLEALLCSRIAVYRREPLRIEMCLTEADAKRLAEEIARSVENSSSDGDRKCSHERGKADSAAPLIGKEERIESKAADFCITQGHLNFYKGTDANVAIPEGVTYINRFAFRDNEHIKSVTFPHGLCTVDSLAFDGCIHLETVSLSRTLKRIDAAAFRNCKSLREVILPDSVVRLYPQAFMGCESLKRVRLSENTDIISSSLFYGCKQLEVVRIPDSVSAVCQGAFGECDSLKRAYVPMNTVIEEGAFPIHTEIVRI